MSSLAFFDTNILVYTDDASSPEKQKRAIGLLADHRERGTAAFSLQVMQEYYSALTRKLRVDPEHAQQKVKNLALDRVIRFEASDVIAAIELHRISRISFWDGMIVHAARMAGASVLYTEDMQHG